MQKVGGHEMLSPKTSSPESSADTIIRASTVFSPKILQDGSALIPMLCPNTPHIAHLPKTAVLYVHLDFFLSLGFSKQISLPVRRAQLLDVWIIHLPAFIFLLFWRFWEKDETSPHKDFHLSICLQRKPDIWTHILSQVWKFANCS